MKAIKAICILWITIFLGMYHAQPPIPEASGCDCDCMACSACDFENACMTVTATSGDVLLDGIGNCVIVESAVTGEIRGTQTNDCILIQGSGAVINEINSRNGDDCIIVRDGATLEGRISGGNDNDCLRLTQVTTSDIVGGAGNDDIIIEGITVNPRVVEKRADEQTPSSLNGQAGDDCIRVTPFDGVQPFMGNVLGGGDNDCIDVQTSDVLTISGGNGNDVMYARCSVMVNMNGAAGNDVMIVEEVTIQPFSTVRSAVNGADGADRILVESLTQNMVIPNGRIVGGGVDDPNDSCCSRVDPSVFEVANCEDETCPPISESTCPRRIGDCVPFVFDSS